MKIDKVTFGRVQNVGNYCSQRVEITANLEDGDTVEDAMETLRAVVGQQLGEGPTDGDIEKAESILKHRDALKAASDKVRRLPKPVETKSE